MSDLRAKSFERILIVKPSAVGDVVHTIPVLVKLRARYPDARIDWLITPENADLVRNHPGLSQVVLFPRRALLRNGSALFAPVRLLGAIRRARYDLVIDLHGQLRTAIFTLASEAEVRIGFDRRRAQPKGKRETLAESANTPGQHGWSGAREGSWLAYTHRMPVSTLDVHAVDRYLWVAPMLGLDEGPPDFRVHLQPEALAAVDSLLDAHGICDRPLAVLVPGTIWESKHWHAEGFAEVGRHLLRSGFAVVLAGTGRDRQRSRAIVADCPGAVDLCGQTTLAGLVALIRRAAVCVTNDSGSMHLAVAEQTPAVSVFGPTSPIRIGPYGRPNAVVRVDLPCSPCYLKRVRDCPNGHRCIRDVTGRMVIERVEQILAVGRTG